MLPLLRRDYRFAAACGTPTIPGDVVTAFTSTGGPDGSPAVAGLKRALIDPPVTAAQVGKWVQESALGASRQTQRPIQAARERLRTGSVRRQRPRRRPPARLGGLPDFTRRVPSATCWTSPVPGGCYRSCSARAASNPSSAESPLGRLISLTPAPLPLARASRCRGATRAVRPPLRQCQYNEKVDDWPGSSSIPLRASSPTWRTGHQAEIAGGEADRNPS